MPAVTGRRHIGLVTAGLAAVVLGTLPASVAAQVTETSTTRATPAAKGPAPTKKRARLSLHLKGDRHHAITVGRKARAVGYLRPFVAGQHVRVKLVRNGHVVLERNPIARRAGNDDAARYSFHTRELRKPGRYRLLAVHLGNAKQRRAAARSPRFHIRYPDLDPGDRNSRVRIFNRLLAKRGYLTSNGKTYSAKTNLAVMAFRKVNGMSRSTKASSSIFRKLAAGGGSFQLKHPGAGRHVEVDISDQVMALADNGEAQYTVPISSGASATPTIRGHYRFYSREPGFNSLGMYYSVYFKGGYAIHGYHSVPPYPASHGCVRNPLPQSVFIYNWVQLGMSIYVYD
jgi:hypothetical protein